MTTEVATTKGNAVGAPLFKTGTNQTLGASEAQEASGVKPMRFFPFITLQQGMSEGDWSTGSYIFKRTGKDPSPQDLSKSFAAVPLSIRGKTTFWDQTKNTVEACYVTATKPGKDKDENIINVRYYEMRDAAREKMPPGERNPYRAGLDVLLWIPSIGCFATYYANTISTTAAVEQIVPPFVSFPVRWFSEKRSNTKGTWFVPSCEALADESIPELLETLPDQALLDEMLDLFNNPKTFNAENDVEGAEVAEEGKSKRSR